MKERPILFSTPMVQSILSNRKLQTRRVCGNGVGFGFLTKDARGRVNGAVRYNDLSSLSEAELINLYKYCPYGQVGDLLWVRENHTYVMLEHAHDLLEGCKDRTQYVYKASVHDDWMKYAKEKYKYKWKPSIHMPKLAARIWLEITDVKIERLQDISSNDAKEEGCDDYIKLNKLKKLYGLGDWKIPSPFSTYQLSFLELWCSINGCESWLNNPWVWVITFKKVAKP